MVYVGKNKYKYGRMQMSHMIADSLDDLHAMADKLKVSRRHFQNKEGKPHYDICYSNKVLAIQLGAKEISDREIIKHFIGNKELIQIEKSWKRKSKSLQNLEK